MILLLLPLMAQVSVAAPVQVRRVPPPTIQMVRPPATVQLLPDLVVKEIRKDGPNAVRALIANDGTADVARTFKVVASASYRSRRGSTMDMSAGPLKAGESQWVRFGPFRPEGESWYPGKPDTPLADWEAISVIADLSYAGSLGGWDGSLPSLDPTKNPCTSERGCVIELDEKNNLLSAAVSSISD